MEPGDSSESNKNMDLLSKPQDIPVNPDSRDSEGFTLLMRASQHPPTECECVDSNNSTLRVIKHLLDSGVDPEARSPDGRTAFEMAVQCNNWPAILALLPRCEVKIGDNVSLTGTHYFHELAKQKDICDEKLRSFTKTLLAHGLNINELDRHGHSPLTLAAKHENWNYIIALLEYGAGASVHIYFSLFDFVIFHHSNIPHSILTALLDAIQAQGVDFNSQNRKGRTILFEHKVYSSIYFGNGCHRELFSLLVDRGVNPLLPDRHGHSLLRFSLDVYRDFELRFLKFLVKIGVTTHQPAVDRSCQNQNCFSLLNAISNSSRL
ncbi:uncharacterized protein LOC112560792 [Pomacea canaliculata]|uniref:uncharacterized protein LOC112560792 n=1 Tax=Pomacea canaliculata TaxID=400727 RepID=UPI000D73EA5E|nr:uncharacterized protein LOC112560792 [Pomacea canaliculata]